MSRRLLCSLCLASAGLALTACQQTRPTLHDLDYPGELQPPANLPIEVVWQQRVTAAWREGPGGELQERAFDAAIQRRGDQLAVLGLSPMGTIGFSITLDRNGSITVDNRMPEQMVIPPRFILLDVQRAFYPWLPDGSTGGSTGGSSDASLEGDVGDEHVTERRAGGRLLERTFVRRSGEPAGTITVTCTWGEANEVGTGDGIVGDGDASDGAVTAAPRRVVLDNGWFGYRLTIDTHAEVLLGADGEDDGDREAPR